MRRPDPTEWFDRAPNGGSKQAVDEFDTVEIVAVTIPVLAEVAAVVLFIAAIAVWALVLGRGLPA